MTWDWSSGRVSSAPRSSREVSRRIASSSVPSSAARDSSTLSSSWSSFGPARRRAGARRSRGCGPRSGPSCGRCLGPGRSGRCCARSTERPPGRRPRRRCGRRRSDRRASRRRRHGGRRAPRRRRGLLAVDVSHELLVGESLSEAGESWGWILPPSDQHTLWRQCRIILEARIARGSEAEPGAARLYALRRRRAAGAARRARLLLRCRVRDRHRPLGRRRRRDHRRQRLAQRHLSAQRPAGARLRGPEPPPHGRGARRAFYLVFGIWGLLETDHDIGSILEVLPLTDSDNLFHLVVGGLGTIAALVDGPLPRPKRRERERGEPEPPKAKRKPKAESSRPRPGRVPDRPGPGDSRLEVGGAAQIADDRARCPRRAAGAGPRSGREPFRRPRRRRRPPPAGPSCAGRAAPAARCRRARPPTRRARWRPLRSASRASSRPGRRVARAARSVAARRRAAARGRSPRGTCSLIGLLPPARAPPRAA